MNTCFIRIPARTSQKSSCMKGCGYICEYTSILANREIRPTQHIRHPAGGFLPKSSSFEMAIKKKKRDYDYVNDDEIGGRVSSPRLQLVPAATPTATVVSTIAAAAAVASLVISPYFPPVNCRPAAAITRWDGRKEANVLHFTIYIAVFTTSQLVKIPSKND